jgi:hypothetical protein
MQVSKKVFGAVMGIATGLVMSCFMSFFLLVVNVGFVEGFLFIWLQSCATAFAISGPVAMIALPPLERLLRRVFQVQE